MQPTGSLHVGNLEGALRNWVNLQEQYWMYCCIVDLHALTADYKDTKGLKDKVFQMAVDFLSAGLDPEKCAIFIQSEVPEVKEISGKHGVIIGGFSIHPQKPTRISIICVLDNLLKGAATQVIQNLNLAFALSPLAGLETGLDGEASSIEVKPS